MSSSFYTVCGDVPVAGVDQWFIEHFYLQSYAMTEQEWDTLFVYLWRLFVQGDLKGYEFLFSMPEPEFEDWVIKARRDLRRLLRQCPEEWPPVGVEETFNKLRTYRRERSRLKRLEAGARRQQEA